MKTGRFQSAALYVRCSTRKHHRLLPPVFIACFQTDVKWPFH